MFWDFLSLSPESLHQVSILFSPRGTPFGYRCMNGYSGHTFKLVNSNGEANWCKSHFKTQTGIKNLSPKDAQRLSGEDPDFATRDLFNHIKNGGSATWKCYFQIMTLKEGEKYRFDPFDMTKVWPQKDYPLIPFGKFVLNRNPKNYFAETEQSAFSPANLVPGIEASPDKMLQGRLFSYNDTHRHRLGPNYAQIPINAPLKGILKTYSRDGLMCVNGNGGNSLNYEPNSFDGPVEDKSLTEHSESISGFIVRSPLTHKNDNFSQVKDFYYKALDDEGRDQLISNICGHLKNAKKRIQIAQTKLFLQVDKEYGSRIAEGLGLSNL